MAIGKSHTVLKVVEAKNKINSNWQVHEAESRKVSLVQKVISKSATIYGRWCRKAWKISWVEKWKR